MMGSEYNFYKDVYRPKYFHLKWVAVLKQYLLETAGNYGVECEIAVCLSRLSKKVNVLSNPKVL